MPKSPKERPGDVLRRFTLEYRKSPGLYPDAVPALRALDDVVERVSRATNDQVAVTKLRDHADCIEDTLAQFDKRPAHRPKGATQYDLDELRREMEHPEHQSVPLGSGFRKRDPWLAHKLHNIHQGKFGQDEKRVLSSIRRVKAKMATEKQALDETLKDDGPFTADALEQFLTGGKSRGGS
jgi:hypothetical protein